MRACLFRTSRDEENASSGYAQRCAASNSKNGNVNFGRDFERDQARRRVLITRNLAELVRLNLDLVSIKGPREALGSKLAPGASRANRFVDFNFDIEAPPWLSPSSSFTPSTRSPHSPCRPSFFSLYLVFLQFPASRRPRLESTTFTEGRL